ncbi:WD domain, G-beta repeat [Novymonas esmeraldas]|uniref:WD domain, G-beta repeat n=1 Tax=Novymonas esmeraldas TaxID=1808958 RepID=A0AAW0ESC1_9TRYP
MSLDITTYQLIECEQHVHFCAPSCDDKLIACALGNGAVCVLNSVTFVAVARGAPGRDYVDVPATCVRWAPAQCESDWQLVSSSSAGGVMLWNWDSTEFSLRRGATASEQKNEVMAMDVSPSGNHILTAGSDRVVRVYDAKLTLLAQLVEGVTADGVPRPTHVNRIFSARFVTEAMAVTAGWESPIQVWDLRARCSNRQIVGLHGVSDCLELVPNSHLVLVASPKSTDTIQIFDSVSGRILDENSQTACTELDPTERVLVCRFQAETGQAWCLTVSPPSVIVLALSSGHVVARAALPCTPLCLSVSAAGAVVGCKDGKLLRLNLLV